MGQAMNMCIDGKGGHTERLSRDNRCRLVAHARQSLHLLNGLGHLSVIALQQLMGELMEILRLRPGEPDLADILLDLFNRHLAQSPRVRCSVKESRGHLIHLLVGGLRGEKDRHQESERVAVVERHRGDRIELFENTEYFVSFLFFET